MSKAKQDAFVREYPKDWNATQAAIRSGYTPSGAADAGHRLLKNPKIQAKLAKKIEKAELSGDLVLRELHRVLTSNIAKAVDNQNDIKNLHDMDENTQRTISSIEKRVGKDGEVTQKVRLWDKVRAIELGMKHFGLVDERPQVHGNMVVNFVNVAPPKYARVERVDDGKLSE